MFCYSPSYFFGMADKKQSRSCPNIMKHTKKSPAEKWDFFMLQ